MAFRLLAKKLISVLLILGLTACAAPSGYQAAFSWQPESAAEKQLRIKAEALQSPVGEGGAAGFTLGAVLGGLSGGMQGAFIGARLGRFVGAASGAYVRGLQQDYATREEQLDRLAQDLELNNRDIESALVTMRQVLAQHRVQLAQARANGDRAAITRERERAAGSVAIMNKTV